MKRKGLGNHKMNNKIFTRTMFLKESPLFTPVKIIACAKIIYSFETHTISIDTSVILIESSLSFPSVKHKIITADGCHHYNN